jgi:hypothetical protein
MALDYGDLGAQSAERVELDVQGNDRVTPIEVLIVRGRTLAHPTLPHSQGTNSMSTPRGDLASISRNLRRLARLGDVAGMRTYICGDVFIAAFKGLDPGRRQTAMLLFAEVHATCEAKAKRPLAPPIALNGRLSAKLANWRDPIKRAKLAAAYARGEGHEGAARLLGVTIGAARLAKRRYLDRAAADTGAKAPSSPTGRRSVVRGPP